MVFLVHSLMTASLTVSLWLFSQRVGFMRGKTRQYGIPKVVVSQDGSGNFTTIKDAVAAAPTNSNASTVDYFLIYVTEGVCEEYVSIPINKPYLMMIGDGINRTVITGHHSVGDGWTTFNSSIFGQNDVNYICLESYFVSFIKLLTTYTTLF